MSTNYRLPDYGEYHLQGSERILYFLEGIIVVVMIGYFFYRSWIACLGLMPVLFLFLKDKRRELAIRERDIRLKMRFGNLTGIWKCCMEQRG